MADGNHRRVEHVPSEVADVVHAAHRCSEPVSWWNDQSAQSWAKVPDKALRALRRRFVRMTWWWAMTEVALLGLTLLLRGAGAKVGALSSATAVAFGIWLVTNQRGYIDRELKRRSAT